MTHSRSISRTASEDIITALSKLSQLFVVARNSSFTFKGKNVHIGEAGKSLGVRYILEGSVRKSGARVRITAQLIDATTNGHLWAERFDRDLTDIFAVQDDVTTQIVSALALNLSAVDRQSMAVERLDNLEAYDCFLRGRETKVQNYTYRGKPATHTCVIAVTWMGDTQLELMQPLTGYSIYDEHLERRGEGLHHVKFYYSDCQKAVADFTSRGYPVIQSGRIDDDEHYYLDTEKDYGYIIELGNAGRIRPAERRYPA